MIELLWQIWQPIILTAMLCSPLVLAAYYAAWVFLGLGSDDYEDDGNVH